MHPLTTSATGRRPRLGSPLALLGAGALSIAAVVACGEEASTLDRDGETQALASFLCSIYAQCNCAAAPNSAGECFLDQTIENLLAEAEALELRYNDACFGEIERYIELLACTTPGSFGTLEASAEYENALYDLQRCKLFYGDDGGAEACTSLQGGGGGGLGFDAGDTCGRDARCVEGLCVPLLRGRGDVCNAELEYTCERDLVCVDLDGDGVQTCETPSAVGQPCNPHDARSCAEDLYCQFPSRVCQALPLGGQPCGIAWGGDEGVAVCGDNSFCDEATNTCTAIPGLGQPCPDFLCQQNLYCEPTAQTCTALPGLGQPCVSGQCAQGYVCDTDVGTDGVCADLPAIVCATIEDLNGCIWAGDGICDEPGVGTGFCPAGTDEFDCRSGTTTDGTTTDGTSTGGTDTDTGGACPGFGDGTCDEPEGTGLCPEGTDPLDCGGFTTGTTGGDVCPYVEDGECDEPEGTGLCPEGTDVVDCA
jgi:hypothetical protein